MTYFLKRSFLVLCVFALAGISISTVHAQGVSINPNWNTSATAVAYYLDVATDAGFTSLLSGYNNLNVGNVTTYTVTGLTCNTSYFCRVRASNGCGVGSNSTTIIVNTSPCILPDTWT